MDNQELEKRVEWYEKRYGPYVEKKGLHNWKNLFRKPNLYEIIILVMLLSSFFLLWAYKNDIQSCWSYVEENCPAYTWIYENDSPNPNLSEIGGERDDNSE